MVSRLVEVVVGGNSGAADGASGPLPRAFGVSAEPWASPVPLTVVAWDTTEVEGVVPLVPVPQRGLAPENIDVLLA